MHKYCVGSVACGGALIALPFPPALVLHCYRSLDRTGHVHCSACLHVVHELGVCVHRHGIYIYIYIYIYILCRDSYPFPHFIYFALVPFMFVLEVVSD